MSTAGDALSPRTIVVLGGGGSLGAFQVGGLLALAEAGIVPDALFGCSVGSLNAAFLAGDPGVERARQLAQWWADPRTHAVLSPSLVSRVTGMVSALARGRALLDERPLRRLIMANVEAHDLAELAVPLTVTTTCLECGDAVHHDRGRLGDVLMASCSLPGLFPGVRLADGHRHVDGGVVCGVPIGPAVAAAGPDDDVLVFDCALAPVTGRRGECAALPDPDLLDEFAGACGLPRTVGQPYAAPVESHCGALELVLTSFAVARAAANRASVDPYLGDERVQVAPHVADAWAAGLLRRLPLGPRDCTATAELVEGGFAATSQWLAARPVRARTA